MDGERVYLYFAPHQDDELSNLGADLCRCAADGRRPAVVLCTDGSASGARRLLSNGGGCAWHNGKHPTEMDKKTFIKARDDEFYESCAAMGVAPADIRIPENRAADGSLTVSHAKRLILEAAAAYPGKRVAAKTFLPVSFTDQNPDHFALGCAAITLLAEGRIDRLELFLERIHLDCPGFPHAFAKRIEPRTAEEKERLLKAAAAYRKWAPEAGRFAVGYHSVYDELSDFAAEPYALALKGPSAR